MIILLRTLSLFLFFAYPAAAQNDSIDILIRSQMQKQHIPGLQLAIVQHGKIVKLGNYGIANVQDSIPVTDNTVFTINSVTKAFTGVAVMQLVEAGKLKLNTPVSLYVKDLPQPWQSVTVLQLLSHTSGIPDIVDEEESVLIAPGADASWKQVLTMPMVFNPGERFQYNQTNYLLLGKIIDTLSGMNFRSFIEQQQLKKVGMSRTIRSGFGATKDIVPHAAGGYSYRNGKLSNMFFSLPPVLQTAAGMSSTAEELAQWIIALQSNQLLKRQSSTKTLFTPAVLNNGQTDGFSKFLNGYAVGWPIVVRDNHPVAAAVGGGRSAVLLYLKDDVSVIVLTNLAGAAPELFIDRIAAFYIPGLVKK